MRVRQMSVEFRKIDTHVHVVGNGVSGSGCWFRLPGLWKQLLGRIMVRGVGLPCSAMGGDLDTLFAENLVSQLRESSLDAAVILAQDLPYDGRGNALPDAAQFYVPNTYVVDLAKRYPEFIAACSIHPGRLDALDELERCIEAGVRVMKLLPNCLNVDYTDKRYLPFWRRMAEAGMILLTHTGGELTVKVFNATFADPKKLVQILECGVTTIAAHAAGRSGLFDPDWTEDLLQMFGSYPHLYADNSALCSLNRARTLAKILEPEVQQRIIHGSDFPVPILGLGPWLHGKIKWREFQQSRKLNNVLERDYMLKSAIGFEAETFTRMDTLLRAKP